MTQPAAISNDQSRRFRIITAAGIAVIAVLSVLVAVGLFTPRSQSTEVLREQLLRSDTEWVIQFDLSNRGETGRGYTITVTLDGVSASQSVGIPGGGLYTYTHHIAKENAGSGVVRVSIIEDGADKPLEETTYYLK